MTSRSARLLLACLALFAASCIKRDLRPLNPCITSGVAKTLSVTAVDKVDLLLAVDNSNSMRTHQRALQQEFPRIIEGLVTGDPDDDGIQDYPPVASLRVAVVSSDIGVGGIHSSNAGQPDVPGCSSSLLAAYYGDNGIFNRNPVGAASVDDPTNCDGTADVDTDPDTLTQATLPDFLTFDPAGALTEADFADRIGCYAVLGVAGCGFEQQLESLLKSLTPSSDTSTQFIAQSGSPEAGGQGDRANAGWLRQDALLAVLMVTDEDDCSASDPRVFNFRAGTPYNDPPQFPANAGPAIGQHANTRCARFGTEPPAESDNGQDVQSLLHPTTRYAEGLIAVKGGDASKVVFGLITGVPVDTVDGSNTTGSNDGVGNLDAILADDRMQYRLITGAAPGLIPESTLQPSCTRCAFGYPNATCAIGWNDLDGDSVKDEPCVDMVGGTEDVCDPGEALNCTAELNGTPGCQIDETEIERQRAVPPRRLVRAARDLQTAGSSVIVQSICQDTFTTAITEILRRIAEALNGSCLPNELNRNSLDEVACQVVEVLPEGRACTEFEGAGRVLRRVEGTREACTVTQIRVPSTIRDTNLPPTTLGAGWFYDDFTDDATSCGAEARQQRISFTDGADPILGSTLRLECSQTVPGDLDGPDVGDSCTAGGTECTLTQEQLDIFIVRYNLAGTYTPEAGPLVCQSVSNTCQVGCASDADCPGGYVCFDGDEGNEGTPFCTDPTCTE